MPGQKRALEELMETVVRRSCRAIFLSPENETLLIKLANPASGWIGWITPGGGMEAGESEEAGLARELKEELGFDLAPGLAKAVWRRRHAFEWEGKWLDQSEVYFLVETEKFLPHPSAPLTPYEMKSFRGYSWWSLPELKASAEVFAPRKLAHFFESLLEEGVPAEPIEVGI